jgi:predicted nucleic acid-binding protein
LFAAAARGDFALVTSTVTITEVLVHPLRSGRLELVEAYRDILLGSVGMTAVPVSAEIAELAARIRAKHNVRTPDALHLATALHSGAAVFVTNDRALPQLSGLEVLLLGEL